jgi:hypothetical protein
MKKLIEAFEQLDFDNPAACRKLIAFVQHDINFFEKTKNFRHLDAIWQFLQHFHSINSSEIQRVNVRLFFKAIEDLIWSCGRALKKQNG